MEKFKATTPDAQLSGGAMIAMLRSINLTNFKHILEHYGLDRIDADKWYSQQINLDIQRAILTDKGSTIYDLVSIGMKVGEQDVIPANSMVEALTNLEASHQMIHRNLGDQPGYEIIRVSDRHIQIIDHTPYPHDLIYGILYGIVKRYKPEGTSPNLRRQNPFVTEFGSSESPIYDITW